CGIIICELTYTTGGFCGSLKEKEGAMRTLCLSLVVVVTPLLGVTPSQAIAQRARAMMSPRQPMVSPAQPMMPLFLPGMGMSQPRMFNSFSPGMLYSRASQMQYGGSGMYAMPYGGYSSYQMPYGGYGSSAPSSSAPAQASQPAKVSNADEIEVSGPLDTPPPHRAVIRLRLPRTWADVSVNGRKVDSMGRTRTYVTPELSGARTFEVTASWQN